MPTDDITNRQLISRETGVALGLVFALVSATWLLSQFAARVDARLQAIESQMTSIVEALAQAGDDRWRKESMERWANRLAEKNPGIVVPDPANPYFAPIVP